MPPQSSIEPISGVSNRLVIIMFLFMIFAPITAHILGFYSSGLQEKRVLASFPPVDTAFRNLKRFTKSIDMYVNDRFGFRDQLVHLNSWIRYRLGVSSNREVVIGADGWLFYTADKLLEQHIGLDIFTNDELESWVQRIEGTRDWLAARGIAFYILVAPDKNTIYPEKIPQYVRIAGGTTRLDQLVHRLETSNLEFVDPRDALIASKKAGIKVYTEGDTHWTQQGALVAYSALMARVRQRFPNIHPLATDDFQITPGGSDPGDLIALLSLEGDLHYTVNRLTLHGVSHQRGSQVVTHRPGWSWPINEVHNDLGNERLLVLGDSFTDYVLGPNFLYETFRDPVFTHHNGGNFNFELINEVQPNIVLFEFAERYLHLVPGEPPHTTLGVP